MITVQNLKEDLSTTSSRPKSSDARSVSSAHASPTAEAIQDWLIAQLSGQLGIAPEEIGVQEPFSSFGLSSKEAVILSGELEEWFGSRLSPTIVWEYPNIKLMAQHLAANTNSVAPTPSDGDARGQTELEPIAIIGLGCRLPGAKDPMAFWQLLRDGVDAITKLPVERWNIDSFYDPTPHTPGKLITCHGGFLEHVDQFDPQFFGISPREARRIDPQQRLLLEVVWEALENAGQAPDKLTGTQTGVFIGISNNDYSRFLLDDIHKIDTYATTGGAISIAANRISYLLDLRGPSLAIDTACSSSLVAAYLACQSLQSGESNLALAGGVNLILTPHVSIALSQAQMLSSDSRCRTFDAQASGYARGEGCGIVVLKRLSDALKNGDHIWALIRSVAVNQDGRSNGLTAPNGSAQQQLIRKALEKARVLAGDIGYIEAHGTGTPLGDPIEARALGEVMREGRHQDRPCLVGSVKTNIGHLEAAAGVAGLIKTALSLHYGEIPPHLHLHNPNPHINFDELPLLVPTEPVAWPRVSERRFAGVSSFSFGGTNAHAILEEAPAIIQTGIADERSHHLMTLSAKSPHALREMAQRCAAHIAIHPEQSLQNICFTANTGRSHFPYRLAVVCSSREQLEHRLHGWSAGEAAAGVRSGHHRSLPKLVFLFTGQGSQYIGMGRQLYETQPTFRDILDRCDSLLRPLLAVPLLSVLYPTDLQASPLDQTAYTQPALFALEYAIAELWRSWGIEPDAVMGHSLGEYIAACVAGVFSLKDGLKLVAERGRLMQAISQPGKMAVVLADEAQVAGALSVYEGHVSIAAVNGPRNVVISGAAELVQEAQEYFEARGVSTRSLNTSHAFHSSLMDPMLDDFEQAAGRVSFESPRITLISNLTGNAIDDTTRLDEKYWRRQTREAVRFETGIKTLTEHGNQIFVEIGPAPVLLGISKRNLSKAGNIALLPTLKQMQDNWKTQLDSLGALYVHGLNVDWDAFERDFSNRRVPLPTYCFERDRYWIESTETLVDGKERWMKDQAQAPISRTEPTRRDSISSTLRGILGNLLEIDQVDLDVQVPFLEMGADSLVLIDAIQAIENSFGVKLSIRQLFEECATIDALAAYLERNLAPEPGAVALLLPEVGIPQPSPQTSIDSFFIPQVGALPPQSQNGEAIPKSGLERVLGQQLDVLSKLFSQQIEVLGGRHASESTAVHLQPKSAATGQKLAPLTFAPAGAENHAAIETSQAEPNGFARQQTVAPFVSYQPIKPGRLGGLSQQQERHLNSLLERYNQRTQKSKRLTQGYRSIMADNRASAGFRLSIKEMLYPIVGDHSRGSRIWDVDGNEYLDVTMGFGVNLLGHNPPLIIEALEQQLKEGIHLGPQSKLAGEVAELICELTGKERVTFCNSGTEAVMTSLRLARTATGRTKVAMFAGSYHGTFDGVLARASAGDGQLHSVPVAPGTPPLMVEDVVVLNYGSDEALDILQAHAHDWAAILVEPVQSRRPDLQPKKFLQQLRLLTRNTGTALIFDEVITGFRIHPGGAQAYFGVEADLAIYGKIVGGGMPIGVVAGSRTFMDGIDGGWWDYGDASYPRAETTFFAGTFCKHPLAMAAARALLKHLKTQGPALQEQLNSRTAQFALTLNAYFEREETAIRIVHFGSLFRFAFAGNLDLLFYHLLEKGVYIWEGRNCFLSTAHTDDDVERLVHLIKQSVEEMRAGGFLPSHATRASNGGPEAIEVVGSNGAPDLIEVLAQRSVSSPTQSRHDTVTLVADHMIQKTDNSSRFPLTEAQRQLWILSKMGDEGSLAYNESVLLELKGPLNLAALRRAVQRIVDRHEALRTIISSEGDFQEVLTELAIEIPLIDLSGWSSARFVEEVSRRLKEETETNFDLTNGPLLRVKILKLPEQKHLLVLSAHHIVVDGWSLGVLLSEMSTFYSSDCQSAMVDAASPMQFREFVQWRRQQDESTRHAEDEAYWLKQLAGELPVLDLPGDHPLPPLRSYRGARKVVFIKPSLYGALKEFSGKHGATLFMTILASYMTLLHRLTGQDDIIVGVPVAGRPTQGGGDLIGYCANLLPIRSVIVGNPESADYLRVTRNLVLEAYEHQDYPFAKLVDRLNSRRDASRSPILAVTCSMDPPMLRPQLHELEVSSTSPAISYAKFDLSLNVCEVEGKLKMEVDFNSDLFDETTIERMIGNLQNLLAAIVADPHQRLSQLPLMSEAERGQLLVEGNQTRTHYGTESVVHELFEQQVERTPAAMALVFEDRQISYRELSAASNQLAHLLQSLGVGPDVIVGICLERSIEMIVGLLGILKAGGAYVPLDTACPKERLAFMLDDSQASILLTQKQLVPTLPQSHSRIICLDSDWQTIALQSNQKPDSDVTADNLAYVVYTSGSTGKPKGVLVPHRGVSNLAAVQAEAFDVRPGARVLQFASLSFDASVSEIFVTLLAGATLYLGSKDSLMPGPPLISFLNDKRITSVTLPPTVWQILPADDLPALESIVTAGEACSANIVARWAKGRRLFNAYGPSEASVCASIAHCSDDGGRPAIGVPIANTEIYLLDAHLEPVPRGTAGELYIGGDGLARGYLNRPDLTAERFIPHPFSSRPGARLYHSGDVARHQADGQLEYLGRSDQQVKLRGYRIELGEIEAVVGGFEGVREAVAVVRAEGGAEPETTQRLICYVVWEAGMEREGGTSRLRSYVREQLPEYMMPAVFVAIERLPLTSSGKIDRQSLPLPESLRLELTKPYVEARTGVERQLAEIWAEVLRVERVGIFDSFFELGGDSILGIQIVARASGAGLHLTSRQLFLHPTIAELASVVDTIQTVRAEQAAVTGSVPLTPIQLWFFEQELPNPHHWNQAVLLDLRQPMIPARLEQAAQQLIVHHDALRLRFLRDGSLWRQTIADVENGEIFSHTDLSSLSEPDQKKTIEEATDALQTSLNLSEGPLMRVAHFDLGPGGPSRLLLVIHHLAVDAVSWRILLEDFQTAYEQLSQGAAIQLPQKTASLKHWAVRLSEYAHSEDLEREMDYWLAGAGMDVPKCPVDFPEGNNLEAPVNSVLVTLSFEETRALLYGVPKTYRAGITDLLLTALAWSMAKWTGARCLLVDLEGHGREPIFDDLDVSRTIGWFTTIYPMFLDLSGCNSPAAALNSVKEQFRRIHNHGLGYGVLRYLANDSEVSRRLQSLSQAEVSFNYLGQFRQVLSDSSFVRQMQECRETSRSPLGRRRHLLEIDGLVAEGRLQLTWTYNENLHRRSTVQELADDFVRDLRGLITYCQSSPTGGLTVSDFPQAKLNQKELEKFIAGISQRQTMVNK